MYKISVRFESNVKDVYTYEEEIATDDYIESKSCRLLGRWLEIICPYIDNCKFSHQYHVYGDYSKIVLSRIQNEIDFINSTDNGGRKFTFYKVKLDSPNETK